MLNLKTKIMKKITATTIVACFALLLFFTGCKKDFRDKYVGEWDFEVKRHWWIGGDTGDTIIYHSGKITLGKVENELIIYCFNDYNGKPIPIKASVDEFGEIIIDNDYFGRGQFIGNSQVHFSSRYKHGGQGGGASDVIDGTKGKKGGKNE